MRNTIKDIGIIGAGVSGVFAALKLAQKHKDKKVIIFEFSAGPGKRRKQIQGFMGTFPTSDGKIYTSDLSRVSEIADGRRANAANKWVLDVLDSILPNKTIKDSSPIPALQKRISAANFETSLNNYIQWKPDQIHKLSRYIADEIEAAGNIEYSFENEVYRISKKKNNFVVNTEKGDFTCKKLILCVGRSGWRWANKLYKDLGILVSDDYATFGARIEIAGQYLKELNKSHCTLTRQGLELGPFSWAGTIIPEDHYDLVISGFRSNEERWKTAKVSFSLLASKYYKDQGIFQTDRLGKLAFLLANDRVGKERIKDFLRGKSELCLIPEYTWMKEMFEELDGIFPNLINKGFFHTPNILPLASKINLASDLESEVEGLYICGESGGFRGLLSSSITGAICADSVCK